MDIMKKMKSYFLLLFMFSVVRSQRKSSSDESLHNTIDTSNSLPIEHAFGIEDAFSPRGNIVFKSSKLGLASFSGATELTDEEVVKLQHLVENNGLYFIRSPAMIGASFSDDASGVNKTNYVQTFVKACYLYGSQLREVITVSTDFSGNVIGLNIVSPRSDCVHDFKTAPTFFNSTVIVQPQVAGAGPDTSTFIRKLEKEAEESKKGPKDNRSFLAKYWMYILPVFLILMLSAQTEQPGEGGGGE